MVIRPIILLSYAAFAYGSHKSLVHDGDINNIYGADKPSADILPPLKPHQIFSNQFLTQSRKTVSMNNLVQIQRDDQVKHSRSVSSSSYESESSDDSQVDVEGNEKETSKDEEKGSPDNSDSIPVVTKGILKKKISSQEIVPRKNVLAQLKEEFGHDEYSFSLSPVQDCNNF